MRKRIIYYSLFCAFVLLFSSERAYAQYYNNFDSDINTIRTNAIPDFRYKYDDYLQYSPAALMLGLKACGYESRSSWGRMLVSDAFSAAIMAAGVNGIKYTVGRPRPDGSANNSFPSGHTATAFMTATLLHKEYGWRSPWFSIGGYSVAAVTAVSRILNNRHWMTDLVGGAAIGIGATHLGYYLSDLIFKDKGLAASYTEPSFIYKPDEKHYVAELFFAHRHTLGTSGIALPVRGGVVGLSTDIPVVANVGATARVSANSMIYSDPLPSFNVYAASVGGYWNFLYAKRFEFQTHALAGAAFFPDAVAGAQLTAGVAASFILDSNFKLKLYADYETIQYSPSPSWLNTLVLGWSSAWFW